MKRSIMRVGVAGALAAGTIAAGGIAVAGGRDATTVAQGAEQEYVVLVTSPSALAAAEAAVAAAGGLVTNVNSDVGMLTVQSTNAAFAGAVRANGAVDGVARNRPVGEAPAERRRARSQDTEKLTAERAARRAAPQAPAAAPAAAGEPLSNLQWDMAMIGATPDGSYAVDLGNAGVRVGIMDTGVDGSHPDIAPNFDAALSRNFTTDIPEIDGPCAEESDQSCEDPADVDENGHGTHVAGTVAAAMNGRGIAGVAPGVTLVNLRAGQDSGYFFIDATVNALTYAGRNGIDVVNMSFYIDPWLYNCRDNPADSPEAQAEQRTIIKATERALRFARRHGVTLISALGNEHTDLGNPTFDGTSPDFPPDAAYDRDVDNSCVDLPAEAGGVISVSALGPSGQKADYSNYGIEQTDLSAPGGWFRDGFGTPTFQTPGNLILAPYPAEVAIAEGSVDPATGASIDDFVIADCTSNDPASCAYWEYLQGTSMASPHAVGVAALVISAHGHRDRAHGGLTMDPGQVEKVLRRTATKTACPAENPISYAEEGRDPSFDALCEGNRNKNGIYGRGIVSAIGAVS